MSRWFACLLLLAGAAATDAAAQAPAPTPVLAEVQARGSLRCGVWGELPGFSAPDSAGVMRGLDADFCRAAAAAALGDATKVEFLSFATPDLGLRALASGSIDLLARNTTITLGRAIGQGVAPVGVLLFDGQGFLVRRGSGIGSLQQLDGRSVCAGTGGGLQAATLLERVARSRGITVGILPAASSLAAFEAFRDGRCEAVTADRSALAVRRVAALPDPSDAILLPEVISREPLGPWVRSGQESWRELMVWVLQALIVAEELRLGSETLAAMMQSDDPEARAILGFEPGIGAALGVAPDFALQVIRQIGNYGEMYARNLGPASGIDLDRGLSDSWVRGGLLFGMPMR